MRSTGVQTTSVRNLAILEGELFEDIAKDDSSWTIGEI
jgi:hypothetical protein